MKNKQTKKESKAKTSAGNGQSFCTFSFRSLLVLAVIVGIASFWIYKVVTTPPDLPNVDLNAYWGPYPMNQNPDLSIRKYQIEFSDVMVNDLKERLLHRRPFTPPLEDAGFTYGFNSNFLTRVLDFWQNKYNFKEREQFFNKYNHYVTNIQGLDIHYMHVIPNVSSDIEVVPLLLLHGWPGSIREFYEIIPKLTTPGPESQFVFEVIVPSLPGFGFSQGSVRPGLGPLEVAVVIKNLMDRIGHKQYYVQGGDAGHTIGSVLATLFPQNILGFHSNMPVLLFSKMANLYEVIGTLWPRLVVEPELESRMYPMTDVITRQLEESGYMHIQATKPDTIGIALTDSPAGLAAYILEKFSTWTNNANKRAGDGNLLSKFTLTQLLDNVMMYWASNSITTSVRLYAEVMNKRFLGMWIDDIPTDVPTWGIMFKNEIAYHSDTILKLKYKNYLHSTIVEDGGHFAALEMYDILAKDIFEAVDTFRQFHRTKSRSNDSQEINYETAKTIYDFTVRDIHGTEVKLDKYKGYVVLIVNVASKCGLTSKNYEQLNELHEKYAKSNNLRILAFPCNQFNGQEPGSSAEIFKFIQRIDVKFDLFEKIDVNGDNAHPLWNFLKRTKGGTLGDFIKWNFSKFIVDKNGVPVERLGPDVDPVDLVPYLTKYW